MDVRDQRTLRGGEGIPLAEASPTCAFYLFAINCEKENRMKPVNNETIVRQMNWRYAVKKFDPNRKIQAPDWKTLEQSLDDAHATRPKVRYSPEDVIAHVR